MSSEAVLASLPILFYVCFGLFYCLAGARFLKVMLIILGVAFGMGLGMLIAAALIGGNPIGTLICGLLGAICGGLLFHFIYKLGVFSAGFAAGSFIAPLLPPLLSLKSGSLGAWAVVFLTSVVVGLLALLLEKQIMIVLSSVAGAVIACVSLHLLLEQDFPAKPDDIADAWEQTFHETWWLVFPLMAAGLIVQSRRSRKSEE
tara:strand:- start:202 stop:807 length:606 start_codon:yes stop_codon:yes gene_type:complete